MNAMDAFNLHRFGVLERNATAVNGALQSVDIRIDDLERQQQNLSTVLGTSVRTLHDDVEQIQQDIDDISTKVDQLEGDVVLRGEEIQDLKEDVGQIQRDAIDLEHRVDAILNDDIYELHRTVSHEISPSLVNAHDDIRELKEENSMLKSELSSTKRELAELQADVAALKRQRTEPSSSFGDVMGLVQANQIVTLRSEVENLRRMVVSADADNTIVGDLMTRAHASMVALQHRADEAAEIINELDDNALNDLRMRFDGLRQLVVANPDVQGLRQLVTANAQQLLVMTKRQELTMWSTVEWAELQRGIPSEIQRPNIFGGVPFSDEQFLLFHARNQILELSRELRHLGYFPTAPASNGIPVLPLTSRPLANRSFHQI
jgi:hypothetical protein